MYLYAFSLYVIKSHHFPYRFLNLANVIFDQQPLNLDNTPQLLNRIQIVTQARSYVKMCNRNVLIMVVVLPSNFSSAREGKAG